MVRQWSIAGRAYPEYDEFGTIVSTTITLASQNDGYATFTETIPGDHTSKTSTQLIKLAKDQYFKKEYAEYAMGEAVVKVDKLERSIKESEILQTTLKDLIESTKAQTAKNTEDLKEAENRRNAVFNKIVDTINEYEQRFTTMTATMNGFMDEIFSIINSKEEPDDKDAERSTSESRTDTTGEDSSRNEKATNDDSSL